MLDLSNNQNCNGFIHLRAQNAALKGSRAFYRRTGVLLCHASALLMSFICVLIRAISRRITLNLEELVICPVLFCIRRLNCSLRSSRSYVSSSVLPISFTDLSAILRRLPTYKGSSYWQLRSCQPERLPCRRFVYTLNFVKHGTRLNECYPVLRIPLSLTHSDF